MRRGLICGLVMAPIMSIALPAMAQRGPNGYGGTTVILPYGLPSGGGGTGDAASAPVQPSRPIAPDEGTSSSAAERAAQGSATFDHPSSQRPRGASSSAAARAARGSATQ